MPNVYLLWRLFYDIRDISESFQPEAIIFFKNRKNMIFVNYSPTWIAKISLKKTPAFFIKNSQNKMQISLNFEESKEIYKNFPPL